MPKRQTSEVLFKSHSLANEHVDQNINVPSFLPSTTSLLWPSHTTLPNLFIAKPLQTVSMFFCLRMGFGETSFKKESLLFFSLLMCTLGHTNTDLSSHTHTLACARALCLVVAYLSRENKNVFLLPLFLFLCHPPCECLCLLARMCVCTRDLRSSRWDADKQVFFSSRAVEPAAWERENRMAKHTLHRSLNPPGEALRSQVHKVPVITEWPAP